MPEFVHGALALLYVKDDAGDWRKLCGSTDWSVKFDNASVEAVLRCNEDGETDGRPHAHTVGVSTSVTIEGPGYALTDSPGERKLRETAVSPGGSRVLEVMASIPHVGVCVGDWFVEAYAMDSDASDLVQYSLTAKLTGAMTFIGWSYFDNHAGGADGAAPHIAAIHATLTQDLAAALAASPL